ncbi:hypothetical protein EIP91_006068 [Steccherinum ochraceum]|uniref:CAP-Gly domain-containing protein n=1 Tax=Steccherinum ochraceum TaxID=92696 RepID=A0A4R0R6J2_9APHY|nr:hypothetical protein EIP91_006068 [Steccherinum ochraceum]
MSTPTPGKGRVSGIPTPGKPSSIPTPGRFRSSSSATIHASSSNADDEFIARAFADAIKANDPGQHPGRPVSSASTSRSSDAGLSASVARPPSRTSDVFRSSSRAGRNFDVGDTVRIESLGFEGTLKYVGEIDGKPGLWAGVELGGGFAGKGKNNGNGTVAGKQYFSCPPYCGVFVATTKLSPPTIAYASISRPSSVASTRSGRVTPSVSGRITPSSSTSIANGRKTPSVSNGRITPSISNGRVTPSTSIGRRTPGIATPAARSRSAISHAPKPAVTPARSSTTEAAITPGSRASKYVGMTAKQLGARAAGAVSPTRKSMGSPTRSLYSLGSSSVHSSPARNGSPFNTPKAGRLPNVGMGMPSLQSLTPSKGRPSTAGSTPKARIPSAIAMPPPASPSFAARSVSLTDGYSKSADADSASASFVSDLQSNQQTLQDRINEIMSGRISAPPDKGSSRPTSAASVISTTTVELQNQIEVLQARLDASESENARLRTVAESQESLVSDRMAALLEEKDKVSSRVTELETSLRTSERAINERDSTIEGLERAVQETTKDVEKAKSDGEARIRDVQSKLDDKEALVNQLKDAIDTKEGLQSKNDALITAKNAEIGVLESRVQKAYTELEEERRELGGQVDELRKAGQETIALYEERLSAADSKRYEMEDLIASLEEQLRQQQPPPSPGALARHASSAAEIDNETLRDQVQHLQKKISSLEDLLEDAQATSEREEAAIRERIKKYKDREEAVRKEVVDSRKEVERVLKAEEVARSRVEEIEEALRENTVALENARAEIEGLRMDVANLEGIAAGVDGETPSRTNRAQLQQEVTLLKQQLAEYRDAGSNGDIASLADQQEVSRLAAAKEQLEAALAEERQTVASLRAQADERTSELEAVRKKFNRDAPVTPSSPSKSELSATKEEIKGLKHIVQELQKENATMAQRSKVLESENKLLLSETDQLREDMKALEDNVEQSLLREEKALADTDGSLTDDVSSLQQMVRDMKTKYEGELEQLRKRHNDAEMKTARSMHQLNKEIGELETLIESKIYREDELEREVERLQDKLARNQKKSSKTSSGLPDDSDRGSIKSVQRPASVQSDTIVSGEVCEICERPGHDIFNCDLLKNEGSSEAGGGSNSKASEELFCEDCEERGHTAAACPHSLDVF